MKTILRTRNILLPLLSLLVFAIVWSCTNVQQENADGLMEEATSNYVEITEDIGMQPWVFDIEETTIEENSYRKAIWTGEYMQLVLMSLKPGEKIDLEVHSKNDQFFRVESGEARVQMGKTQDELTFDEIVKDDFAILIPAGYWHQITNVGDVDLKLYTLYGPPEHEPGTINKTYEEAKEYELLHHH